MSFDPSDAYEHGCLSSCCGARVLMGCLCAACKEHCDVEPQDAPEEREFNPEQQAIIDRMERELEEPK